MKIGIISDTHDNLPAIDRAIEVFTSLCVEAIIHAGDFVAPFAAKPIVGLGVPVYAVFGNCDGERDGLAETIAQIHEPPHRFDLGGLSVLVGHDRTGVDEDEIIRCGVFVYGHDHTARIAHGKTFIINPGECCGYVVGRSSVALLDSESMEAHIIDL